MSRTFSLRSAVVPLVLTLLPRGRTSGCTQSLHPRRGERSFLAALLLGSVPVSSQTLVLSMGWLGLASGGVPELVTLSLHPSLGSGLDAGPGFGAACSLELPVCSSALREGSAWEPGAEVQV